MPASTGSPSSGCPSTHPNSTTSRLCGAISRRIIWFVKCEAVAASLEEAGDKLFTFTRLPVEQWKSARTTNAIERLHEEFKRRIKTQTVLPSAETAAMLFCKRPMNDQGLAVMVFA